jgi:acyl-CoA hydrolase
MRKVSPKQEKVNREIGIAVVKFGKTSLTLKCEVRNMMTLTIITIDSSTMVNLGIDGSQSSWKTEVEFVKTEFNSKELDKLFNISIVLLASL